MIFLPFLFDFHLEETFQSKIYVLIFRSLKPWPQIRGEVIRVFFYFIRATMPFRLYLIYLIRLVYCICSDILPHSLKLLHHLSIHVYLAFNASYFISILYVSFCPHGYEGLICSWIDMYICTYIQYFFVFSRLKLVAEERMVQGL